MKTIRVDGGEDQVVFSHPGDAFLERAIGTSIALSERGGRIALVGKLSRFQTNRPAFPLRLGSLEVWDAAAKTGRTLPVVALDRRLSWFPDSKRLAYVELLPREKTELPPDAAADGFGSSFASWEAVPVVKVIDVENERRSTLHVGWDPILSAGGRHVLLRDVDSRWRMVEVESGRSEPVRLPGDAGGPIALTADGLVLYWGLPTDGSRPEFTRVYSSAVGPRPMKTFKVADLQSQRFETVLRSVDPRRDVSFGPAP